MNDSNGFGWTMYIMGSTSASIGFSLGVGLDAGLAVYGFLLILGALVTVIGKIEE